MNTLIPVSASYFVHALGWTLLHFCWQGALVGAMLWCVLSLLGGRSSEARYGAACFAMLLMIALPVITFARIASVEYESWTSSSATAVPIDMTMLLRVGAHDTAAPWPVQLALSLDHAVPWLLGAWFAGAIFFVVRLNIGLMVARRLRREGTVATSNELRELFNAVRVGLGIDRAVRLLHSSRVQVPTVIGWLRPVVLIPISCLTGLSTDQVEAIFCHELAHVRRHDYLVSVFQSVAEALLFYHPAVWWVSTQVRRERECCCDEIAVRNGGNALAYARALSGMEERRAEFPEFVLGANGGALTMRIKRLLGCKDESGSPQLAASFLLLLMAGISATYVSALAHAQQAPTMPGNAATPALSQLAVPPQTDTTPPPAHDASANGTITGVVVDQTGAVIAHATVAASSTGNRFTMTRVTDALGRYTLSPLPAASYTVGADAPGFERTMKQDVKVDRTQQVALNLRLMVGAVTQNMTVAASADTPPPASAPLVLVVPGRTINGPVRVSSGTMAGMMISKVDPIYPTVARDAHVQGVVVLQATISKLGTIENLQVVSGTDMLIASAIDAVRQWKYKPYLLNGEPTQVNTTINMNYALAGEVGHTAPEGAVDAGSTLRKIGGGVSAPVLIHSVDPEYTPEAKNAGFMGVVLVNLVVDKRGMPQGVHVLRGIGLGLDQKAVQAVQQYRFTPAMEGDKPVPVEMNIEVNFQMGVIPTATPQAAQTLDGGQHRVSDGAIAPVLMHAVSPEYSKEARKAKMSGTVLVNLTVDRQGRPKNVHVTRGIGYGLDEKAVDAVKQYKFKPAMKDNLPVGEELNVEVNFQIF